MTDTIFINGRYRNVVTTLSGILLEHIIVEKHKRLDYDIVYFKHVINTELPLQFYIGLQTKYSNDIHVTGDAYNPTEEFSEQIPYIEISVSTNGNKKHRSEIAMQLRNSLRHEIEHLTQSGLNTKPGKYLPDDQKQRETATTKEYLLLKKEIPAMLKGLHFQATKQKIPFDVMLYAYLDNSYLYKKDIEEVKSIWINKAKELNLWKK